MHKKVKQIKSYQSLSYVNVYFSIILRQTWNTTWFYGCYTHFLTFAIPRDILGSLK